jgi:hypothetical protein
MTNSIRAFLCGPTATAASNKGEVGLGSSSGNLCAQQAKQILWLICPRAATSLDMGTPSLVCRALHVTVCPTSARTK